MPKSRLGRNDYCPCGTGEKYKSCCQGKVDWDALRGSSRAVEYLSARGKNMAFLDVLRGELGLDRNTAPWVTIKKSLTKERIKNIHAALIVLWSDLEDVKRALRRESRQLSALYIGQMDPESILAAVRRNCLHVDKFLIPDPFTYPGSVRPQFDPLLSPELHGGNTLKAIWTWLELEPWIVAGIVVLVRLPTDFDPRTALEFIETEEARSKLPEFSGVLHADLQETLRTSRQMRDLDGIIVLSRPKAELRAFLKGLPEYSNYDDQRLDVVIGEMRDGHPFYLDPRQLHGESIAAGKSVSELHLVSTGGTYGAACLAAKESGSFLITDVEYKWRVIEHERKAAGVDEAHWAPLSKALAKARLRHLDNVTLAAAFELRRSSKLASMRHFMRRLWGAVAATEPYDASHAQALAAELDEEINKAEREWKDIDHVLAKWLGPDFLAGGAALGLSNPWLAGGAVLATGVQLGLSINRHHQVAHTPAGFFLKRLSRPK